MPAESIPIWPTLNAGWNLTATVLLVAGLFAIRAERKRMHAVCMIGAGVASSFFLAGYLYYHFGYQSVHGPVKLKATGGIKVAYLVMLATHILGAIINLPMVITTFTLAARRDWVRHRRWAKRTFPLWLYVSVTGVLVYWALYRWNPA